MSFIRTPDGQLIGATNGTSTGYFLTDNLRSTVGIVNITGSKTAAYAYDPYGRTRTATGTAAATNAIRYAGGLYDTTTGATKFGARYYDPNTGRFTQPDPSGREQNPYEYTRSGPTTFSDPSGLDCSWYEFSCSYAYDSFVDPEGAAASFENGTDCLIYGGFGALAGALEGPIGFGVGFAVGCGAAMADNAL